MSGPSQRPAPRRCRAELDVALDHPEVESINYHIDVADAGATSDRNRTLILACSSDGKTAACDE